MQRSLVTAIAAAAALLATTCSASASAPTRMFTGIARVLPANDAMAATSNGCTAATNAHATAFVALSHEHFDSTSDALRSICDRCVFVQIGAFTATLFVSGSCRDCARNDVALASSVIADAFAATRVVGDDDEATTLAVQWRFVPCPMQPRSLTSSTAVLAEGSSTGSSADAVSVQPTATATPCPTTAPTHVTSQPPAVSTTTASVSPTDVASSPPLRPVSSSHTACSPVAAGDSSDASPCDLHNATALSVSSNNTTLPPPLSEPTTTAVASQSTLQPTASTKNDASSRSGRANTVVTATALSAQTTSNAAARTVTMHTRDESNAVRPTASTEAAAMPAVGAAAPDTSPQRGAPLLMQPINSADGNDDEAYTPSTRDSIASRSSKRRRGVDTDAPGATDSDNSSSSREQLLRNPIFVSAVLLAVVGVVGAAVVHRVKARARGRYVTQRAAWRHFSQRMQAASPRSRSVETPSPGGSSDAYAAVSSTTRHAARSASTSSSSRNAATTMSIHSADHPSSLSSSTLSPLPSPLSAVALELGLL